MRRLQLKTHSFGIGIALLLGILGNLHQSVLAQSNRSDSRLKSFSSCVEERDNQIAIANAIRECYENYKDSHPSESFSECVTNLDMKINVNDAVKFCKDVFRIPETKNQYTSPWEAYTTCVTNLDKLMTEPTAIRHCREVFEMK